MKEICQISLGEYCELLKKKRNAVPWNPPEIAQPISAFRCFHASLDSADEDRVFFWWEHKVHTEGKSGKWTDVLASSASNMRIKPLLEGDPSNGWGPVDLRTATGFEPMIITHDFDHGPLLAIDGNHRMIAQRIRGDGLVGAKVFVCCHPAIIGHGYITDTAKVWFQAKAK